MNDRIRALRKCLGLNQSEFAKGLHLSRSAIYALETGRRRPSERTLLDICRVYNVNPEWLMSGRGDMLMDREAQIRGAINDTLKGAPCLRLRRVASALSELGGTDFEALARVIADSPEG